MAEQNALQGDLQAVQPALLTKLGTALISEGDPSPALVSWKWHPGTESLEYIFGEENRIGEIGDLF